MQLGIVGPVELAVHNVVADFHVVEYLGNRQCSYAQHKWHGCKAKMNQGSARNLEVALNADDVFHVIHIFLAQVGTDLIAQRIKIFLQIVELLFGEALVASADIDLGFLKLFHIGLGCSGHVQCPSN